MKWISSGGGSHASNKHTAAAERTVQRPARVRRDDTQDLPRVTPEEKPVQAARQSVPAQTAQQPQARTQTRQPVQRTAVPASTARVEPVQAAPQPQVRTPVQQSAPRTAAPASTARVYPQSAAQPQVRAPARQTVQRTAAPASTARVYPQTAAQPQYRSSAAVTDRIGVHTATSTLPAGTVSAKLPSSANGRAYISPRSTSNKQQREKPVRTREPIPEPTQAELDAEARLPSAREGRVKPAGRKKRVRRRLVGWAITLVVLACLYLFCVYTTIPFIANLRSLYIETAMMTMEHQWLATYFIPRPVIDETMKELDELEAMQETMESDWGSYKAPTTTVLPSTQKVSSSTVPVVPDDNDPETTEPDTVPEPVVLEFWEDPDHDFWKVYSELDYESFHEYANVHRDEIYSEEGYLFIDQADAQSKGTDILTKQGDRVLAIDAKNGIILVRLNGSEYEGVLAIVKDPKQITMGVASHLGVYGSKIATLAEENDAILAINASGFQDDDGMGNGGVLYGMLYVDGKKVQGTAGSNYKAIYFDSEYRLNVRSYKKDLDIYNGVEFKPALVINGEAAVTGSAGWGIQPRSAIGQTDDGTVLMIIVDGRQPTYSVGITVGELAKIFVNYGAVQAGNLDGGSSAVMYYNGRVITKPSGADKVNGRKLPDAFVVRARDAVYGQAEPEEQE